MANDLSVVIMAAGKGTRMYSKKPKVLLSLGGIPFVAHPIHTSNTLDPERIVVIVGYEADMVKESVNQRFGEGNIRYALQAEQNGTAHAVMCAKDEVVDGPSKVLILSGDVPLLKAETLEKLLALQTSSSCSVAMIGFDTPDPTGYGRVLRDAQGKVRAIREHRDCTEEELEVTECNAGIYLVDRDFLFSAFDRISNENDQGEYYLTDIVELAYADGSPTEIVIVDEAIEVMGANDRSQLSQLEDYWLTKRRNTLMKSGVTMRLPESIFIDYDVVIEQDVEIGAHTCLLGKTTIESGASIGPQCVLENAHVRSGESIKAMSLIQNHK